MSENVGQTVTQLKTLNAELTKTVALLQQVTTGFATMPQGGAGGGVPGASPFMGTSATPGASQEFSTNVNKSKRATDSFTGSIVKNIGSFIKWSLAMSAVMIPLRLLIGGVQDMIETEEKLARISIILGTEQEVLQKAFTSVAREIRGTGVELNEALDAYQFALKATASISDENERLAVSNQLLADSTNFARLSGMESADSIDALVAITRQWGLELSDVEEIMDSFARTQDTLSVSFEDLAVSQAIAGAQAQSTGLTFEEFNTLIGITAENTLKSSTEVGNFLKQILGDITGVGGAEALAVFEISTVGKDPVEILTELATLQERMSGKAFDELMDSLFSERRRADVKAILPSIQEYSNLLSAQQDSSKTAEEAMRGLKDTLTSATSDLGNSFLEFFMVLDSGLGIVDALAEGLGILTQMMQGFADVGTIFFDRFEFDPNTGTFVEKEKNLGDLQGVGTQFGRLVDGKVVPFSEKELADRQATADLSQTAGDVSGGGFGGKPQLDVVSLGRALTEAQLTLVENLAIKLEAAYIEATAQGNIPLIENIRGGYKGLIAELEAGQFKDIEDIPAKFFTQALGVLEDQGALGGGGLGLTTLPIDFAQSDEFVKATRTLGQKLAPLGFETEETAQIVQFEDGQFATLTFDQKLANIILKNIEDNTSDMVEGVFNLPTDASIVVPLTAAMTTVTPSELGEGNLSADISTLIASIEDFIFHSGSAGTGGASFAPIEVQTEVRVVLDGREMGIATSDILAERITKAGGGWPGGYGH